MQHNSSDEGSPFAIRQNESFVCRSQTIAANCDINSAPGVTPGVITSGNPILNAFVSSRTNISGLSLNEYFSKAVKSNAISGLRIPVGISPNNDGLNDRFIIENLNPTDKVRIEIYDRLQSLVFRDANYKNNFEGVGNQKGLVSNDLPDGTYYYILNFNDSKPIIGYIIINR
jgi:gliding motility-associated-like protein